MLDLRNLTEDFIGVDKPRIRLMLAEFGAKGERQENRSDVEEHPLAGLTELKFLAIRYLP